jgi:hypothetical protein
MLHEGPPKKGWDRTHPYPFLGVKRDPAFHALSPRTLRPPSVLVWLRRWRCGACEWPHALRVARENIRREDPLRSITVTRKRRQKAAKTTPSQLQSATARLKLAAQTRPYFVKVASSAWLGYRKPLSGPGERSGGGPYRCDAGGPTSRSNSRTRRATASRASRSIATAGCGRMPPSRPGSSAPRGQATHVCARSQLSQHNCSKRR